jgi:hypothetical protein
MRRGADDLQWQQLVKNINKRDKKCRLLKILSLREFLLFSKNAKGLLSICDPAHIFGAGPYPHMIYLEKNVVLLNRFSHECLDSCKNPITGEAISITERNKWWEKIVGTETYQYLLDIAFRRTEE